jgi:iron complex outermembrane receptor protein
MRRYPVRCGYFLVLSLLSSKLSYSQTVIPPAVGELDSLVINGSSSTNNPSNYSIFQQTIQDKAANNIGDALNSELGVSSSSFGQTANRPIIRGMDGSRVPILQNGTGSGDVSTISNDHAVATEILFNDKIEILRGADALRYSSGANQGLVNLLNSRISSELLDTPRLSFASQYDFNNQGFTNGLLAEDSIGQWALHIDDTSRQSNNYQRPDGQYQAYSFAHQNDLGVGASYIRDRGFTGLSYNQYQNFYGIPSAEGSQIDMKQNRFEMVDEQRNPWSGIKKIETKFSYVDYNHTEITPSNVPQTYFQSKAFDARVELFHNPFSGWEGSVGLTGGNSKVSATDLTNPIYSAVVIPKTKSMNFAAFIVENQSFGQVDVQNGLRYEWVQRQPSTSVPYTDAANFDIPSSVPAIITPNDAQFSLISASTQAFWNYAPSYALGLRYSYTQRAPSIAELYSFGNHDATATFDVGNPNLSKEAASHIELGWRKLTGLVQAKVNLYQEHINNFIYALYTGAKDTDTGYSVRQFSQGNAKIQGAESEITYNLGGEGVFAKAFGDLSQGTLEQGGYLPLQPATRIGGSIGYGAFGWRSNLSLIHAFGQNNVASSPGYTEPTTNGYNKLDLRISKTLNFNRVTGTVFFQANNLLNDTIRYSTTVDNLRVNAPQPGRAFLIGVKLDY